MRLDLIKDNNLLNYLKLFIIFRGDMIDVFKMIHNIKVNLGKLCCIDEDGRRRKPSLCLKFKWHVNLNIGLNFFIRRIINYWNQLTDEAVSCKNFKYI